MRPVPTSELLRVARALATQSGELLLSLINTDLERSRKQAFDDIVTKADTASEQLIRAGLADAFPEHGFWGEETGQAQLDAAYRWVVDPLDGTANYASGLPLYTVSIGCVFQGEPLVGVVYAPAQAEMFWAVRGEGAWLGERRLWARPALTLDAALLMTGYSLARQGGERNLEAMRQLDACCLGVRRLGCASIGCTYVAAGRLGGWWSRGPKPWDVAAGLLLARESGAVATDFTGAPASVEGGDYLICTPEIHTALLEILQPIYAST